MLDMLLIELKLECMQFTPECVENFCFYVFFLFVTFFFQRKMQFAANKLEKVGVHVCLI